MQYVKTDIPDLVRDTSSGAIINTNDSYYKQLVASRSQAKQTQEVCQKMKALEGELTEIKMLLQQVLNGR
jgi:hypothetical protein